MAVSVQIGSPAVAPGGLEPDEGLGRQGRHRRARPSAPSAAFICHPPARQRRQFARGANAAGAFRPVHHPDLYPGFARAAQIHPPSAPSARIRSCRQMKLDRAQAIKHGSMAAVGYHLSVVAPDSPARRKLSMQECLMRTFTPPIVVSLIALIIASAAVADQDAITQRVSGLVPEIETLNIAETPLPGVMEVQVNGEIIYMSEDGRYLMQGRLVDMNTQTDLTDAAKSVLRREAVSQLDDDKMVIFGNDDADYELMVFTDVDCGYCRRLHQQIEEYTEAGIRVKYMAFPRAGIGSETYDKMVSIWCADDPRGAMTVAKSGQQPAPARCDNPVEEQYRLGKQLGVTGTPSLITPNGEMIPGYVPPQQLRESLDQLTQARSAGNWAII